jgi:hypothetical protein
MRLEGRPIAVAEARCQELSDGSGLQIMYGIRGEHDLSEIELTHLEGYKGVWNAYIPSASNRDE